MTKITKILLGYWLEILVGGLILIFVQDIRWFLFYLLINCLLFFGILKRLIRVFGFENEIKLISIIRKLNISQEEIQKVRDDYSDSLTDEERKSLQKDMNELGISNPQSYLRNPLDGLSDVERGKKFMNKVFETFGDSKKDDSK